MTRSIKECEYHDVSAALLFLCGKLGQGRDFKKIEKVIQVCGSEAKKAPIDTRETSVVVKSHLGIQTLERSDFTL